MPIRFHCRNCRARVKTPDGSAGKRVKCPRCGASQEVPAESQAALPVAEAAASGSHASIDLSEASHGHDVPAEAPLRELPVPQPHPVTTRSVEPAMTETDKESGGSAPSSARPVAERAAEVLPGGSSHLVDDAPPPPPPPPVRQPQRPAAVTPAAPPPSPPPPFLALLLLGWLFRLLALALIALAAPYVLTAAEAADRPLRAITALVVAVAAIAFTWLLGELALAVRALVQQSVHR